jgi:hypothetical protein
MSATTVAIGHGRRGGQRAEDVVNGDGRRAEEEVVVLDVARHRLTLRSGRGAQAKQPEPTAGDKSFYATTKWWVPPLATLFLRMRETALVLAWLVLGRLLAMSVLL